MSCNGFVLKLSSDGSSLNYSTYLGGSDYANPVAVAVDQNGEAYVAGYTESTDFPTTAGALQYYFTPPGAASANLEDGFIVKLTASGNAYSYSTFLGGTALDTDPSGIALDAAGDAFLTGYTFSGFPTTPNAYQTSIPAGVAGPQAFFCELDPGGDSLLYSTFLAGTTGNVLTPAGLQSDIAVDSYGNAYLTGVTASNTFPITAGAYEPNFPISQGGQTGYVAKFGLASETVPNVVGLTQAAATSAITGAGLVVGTVTTQSSSTVASGSVISQSPPAGYSVTAGSAVDLTISSGPAPEIVPNVVGLTQAAATSAITGAGLVVGTVTTQSSSTVASGSVISQSPPAGYYVTAGSAVDLTISSGPAPEIVPNVVGLTQAAATSAITGAGLVVGTVATQSSSTVASGSVISQSPPAGYSVTAGSAVNLTISSGPTLLASVTPATGMAGTTFPVTFAGTGLTGATAVVSGNAGISGTITGASSTSVTASVSITATATTGVTSLGLVIGGQSYLLSFTVNPATTLTSVMPATGMAGTTFPVTFAGTGLTGATAVVSGNAGISGTITGASSTSVTASVSITATATTGVTSLGLVIGGQSYLLSFTVNPATTLTSVTPATGMAGTTFPVTFAGTGLTGATAVVSGNAGISGTITGASSTSVTASVSITATATTGVTSLGLMIGGQSHLLSFTVNSELTITTTSLVSGEVGLPYSATVAAIGGTMPYKWSATGLPAGLMINQATGAISGTPTVTGMMAIMYEVVVTVTDSNGHIGSRSYALTINPKPTLTLSAITANLLLPRNSLGVSLGFGPINSCNSTYNGVSFGNLTVSVGQNCTIVNGVVSGDVQLNGGNLILTDSRVGGNVVVNGGNLILTGSQVGGSVQVNGFAVLPLLRLGSTNITFTIGPGSTITGSLQILGLPPSRNGSVQNQVCGTTIRGGLQFQDNGTAVLIGSANPASCAGNVVGSNLVVQNNSAITTVVSNTVGGNLQVQNNTGPTQVYSNTVTGNLQCQSNTSITEGGNTVTGQQQGQCAPPSLAVSQSAGTLFTYVLGTTSPQIPLTVTSQPSGVPFNITTSATLSSSVANGTTPDSTLEISVNTADAQLALGQTTGTITVSALNSALNCPAAMVSTVNGQSVCTVTATYNINVHSSFFQGETSLGSGGFYNLSFFGDYTYLGNQLTIYQSMLGYEAILPTTDANRGIYFYDYASGHIWYTNPSDYPNIYDFTLNSWFYYETSTGNGTAGSRTFYDYTTGKFITL